MRNLARLAPGLLLVGGAAAGCLDPERPTLSYSLNANIVSVEESRDYNADLARDAAAQAQLAGALEMLFGTPGAPGYLRPEEWIDDEYDPNAGSYELSEAEWEEVVEDNRRAFRIQLAQLAARDLEAVVPPREALDVVEDWTADLAEWRAARAAVEQGEKTQAEVDELAGELADELADRLIHWYPSLRESAEMYRQQCYHCHGVEGGGDGSTARFLDPRPRDYRKGIFKFTALDNKARPRREDLYRILEEGVYGSAMPSFARFSRAQLNGLVDYVRLLSIRGETELRLAAEYDSEVRGFPMEVVRETYLDVWSKWDAAADWVIAYDGEVPRATPERIAHGRELFMDAKSANCFSCHGPDGRGGGPSAFEARPMTPELEAELARLDAEIAEVASRAERGEEHERALARAKLSRLQDERFALTNERVKDDWGNEISPRDLTRGLYRFGRRPIDLYRRVYAGINGTPMPSHSSLKGPDGERLLSDEDLWDIVHYVRSLATHDVGPTARAEQSGSDDSHGSHGS